MKSLRCGCFYDIVITKKANIDYHFYKILSKYSSINPHYGISQIPKENKENHHILSSKEIQEKMKDVGYEIDRRTIYKYIDDLKELGFEVSTHKDNGVGYALITKDIETYELRMLVDSISSNRFMTKKKTKELVDKLCNLLNGYVAYDLSKQVLIDDRSKPINEEILYSIDNIDAAINKGKKISFNYCDYNYKKELIYRNQKGSDEIKTYVATPVGLIFKEDYYYVVLSHDKYEDLTNYRVDRMKNVQVLEEDGKPLHKINGCEDGKFNAAMYSKQNFKMFSGVDSEVILHIKKGLINLVIDELGEDVELSIVNEDTYQAKFDAKLGAGLTKWVLQLGADANVISPDELRCDVKRNLEEIMKLYK